MLLKSRLHFSEDSMTSHLVKLLQALVLVTNEFSLCFVSQLLEPVLLLGKERFAGVDIRVRVKGGGHVAQIYGTVWVAFLGWAGVGKATVVS